MSCAGREKVVGRYILARSNACNLRIGRSPIEVKTHSSLSS
eukprot:SAG31_NODE_13666_length_854_cov_1.227815_1_plen_40_part_10